MAVHAAFAQSAAPDTAFLSPAKAQALAVYRQAVGEQSHLFNGPAYINHSKHYFRDHQFFITDSLSEGAAFYDGAWHTGVPLLYDLITDEVITANQGALQKLLPEKLTSFSIKGHTFVHLPKDSLANTPLQPGMYELLYSQTTKVYAKRSKQPQELVEKGQMTGFYVPVNKYYILKDGRYHPVGSQSAVLKVFKDEKKPLKKHLNAQKLRFSKQKEAAIIEAATFYDAQQL